MTEEPQAGKINFDMDPENLYREENYTDLKTGSIRKLIPIKVDGSRDAKRRILFTGHTQLMSEVGPVPVQCVIEADSLREAVEKFPGSVNQTIERMVEEAKEIRRQEASRIVIPGEEAASRIKLP